MRSMVPSPLCVTSEPQPLRSGWGLLHFEGTGKPPPEEGRPLMGIPGA